MKNKFCLSILLGLSLSFLTACKQGAKDADRILDAQNCLDTAQITDADACVAKVDGIDSQGADLIRCVGKFVGEGFNDPAKISAALDNLTTGGTGATGSASMIAALSFTHKSSEALNAASATEAYEFCTKAKTKGLIFLSSLAQTSTVLASLSAGIDLTNPTTITGANLQAAMGALAGDAQAQAAVGNSIVSIYNSNCTNDQTTTGAYCTQFASAIAAVSGGTSNPAGVGQQVMICYNNPAAAGCTGF